MGEERQARDDLKNDVQPRLCAGPRWGGRRPHRHNPQYASSFTEKGGEGEEKVMRRCWEGGEVEEEKVKNERRRQRKGKKLKKRKESKGEEGG